MKQAATAIKGAAINYINVNLSTKFFVPQTHHTAGNSQNVHNVVESSKIYRNQNNLVLLGKIYKHKYMKTGVAILSKPPYFF